MVLHKLDIYYTIHMFLITLLSSRIVGKHLETSIKCSWLGWERVLLGKLMGLFQGFVSLGTMSKERLGFTLV